MLSYPRGGLLQPREQFHRLAASVIAGGFAPRPAPPDVAHCLSCDAVLFAQQRCLVRRLAVLLLIDESGVICRQLGALPTDDLLRCRAPCIPIVGHRWGVDSGKGGAATGFGFGVVNAAVLAGVPTAGATLLSVP